MGYFSKCCAKSFLPVVVPALGFPELNEVVALLPDGRVFEGAYDGYGCVGGANLQQEFDEVKLVLKSRYAGESFEDLGVSIREPGQGYFLNYEFLRECLKRGSFATPNEYESFFEVRHGL